MKKVKDYIKKNPEPAKGRFGVNPHDPWSAKYNVAEDLTTKTKGAGDSRSKVAHSPTQQRASELDKAAKFYQVKNPTGTMGSKVHHEDKHMNKKEGNQNTLLTPESVQKCNKSPAGKMCEVHGMKACKTMNEAKKKMSALDKWRQASYGREKAHKEFMKSIEHLPHQQQMQKMMDKIKSDRASVHKEEVVEEGIKSKIAALALTTAIGAHAGHAKAQTSPDSDTKQSQGSSQKADEPKKPELNPGGPRPGAQWRGIGPKTDAEKEKEKNIKSEDVRGELKHIRKKEAKVYNKEIDGFNKKVKEIHAEETITELSAKKLLGYMMKAGSKKDPKKDTKDRSKNTLKATGKYLKKIDEETYMDAKAATPAVMSPGEGISEKKTTLQRVMALKKKKLKEDMFDHEKEDKSVATYGKKPKFEKAEKDEGGEKKPQAAAVMTGGTTLTGSKRDTIEIDPMMRNRPGQPDVTKKDDKKDEKDKDKKKDK
jgi:hypothetical protein